MIQKVLDAGIVCAVVWIDYANSRTIYPSINEVFKLDTLEDIPIVMCEFSRVS